MPVAINGSGTITGVSVGGLPDGIVDTDMIAAAAVTAAKRGAGAILQIQQTHLTTTSSQSLSQATVAEISGLSVSITPVSSTSDMLIFVRWNGEHGIGSNYNFVFGVRRDSTDIGNPSASGNRMTGQAIIAMGFAGTDASSTPDSCYYSFLDTARSSGTSQITYKATVKTNDAGTFYNQRTGSNLDTGDYELLTSNITVMEVAA
jgi:hypothetical protein|tara:strand:+ start:3226 stop:3837 length:612 start_codon:yes stop_codon:yes gene_type:complete